MWIVVEVGCLKCGNPTTYVGTFLNEKQAEAAADALNAKYEETNADFYAEVFFIQSIPYIARDFNKILAKKD